VSVLHRSRRIAKSGGLGLDLAIQAERANNGGLVFFKLEIAESGIDFLPRFG
jgi:hypothetical protein